MYALEIINAINAEGAPLVRSGLNARLRGPARVVEPVPHHDDCTRTGSNDIDAQCVGCQAGRAVGYPSPPRGQTCPTCDVTNSTFLHSDRGYMFYRCENCKREFYG